jgi:hypothetical protein
VPFGKLLDAPEKVVYDLDEYRLTLTLAVDKNI